MFRKNYEWKLHNIESWCKINSTRLWWQNCSSYDNKQFLHNLSLWPEFSNYRKIFGQNFADLERKLNNDKKLKYLVGFDLVCNKCRHTSDFSDLTRFLLIIIFKKRNRSNNTSDLALRSISRDTSSQDMFNWFNNALRRTLNTSPSLWLLVKQPQRKSNTYKERERN